MSKARTRAPALQASNRRYWTATSRKGISAERLKRHLEARQSHFEALRKIPFMRRLLDPAKQKKIEVTVSGRTHSFTLLGVGLGMARYHRPVVVVLDSLGRRILFYKSTGVNSGRPGAWLPFNSRKMQVDAHGRAHLWYEKFGGHPKFPESHLRLGEAITRREKELEFMKTSDPDLIEAIAEYL